MKSLGHNISISVCLSKIVYLSEKKKKKKRAFLASLSSLFQGSLFSLTSALLWSQGELQSLKFKLEVK